MHNITIKILLLLLIVSAVIGCKTKQSISSSNNGEEVIRIGDVDPVNPTPADIDTIIEITTKPEELDSTKVYDELYKKNIYTIGLFLPLMEDSVRSNWEKLKEIDYDKFEIPLEAENALSFLEGFMQGFRELDNDLMYKINLYDTRDDSYTLNTLLANKVQRDSIDLIIGGYTKNETTVLSAFAKKNDLLFISPFSPSESASNNYANYLMIESSINYHLLTLLKYAVSKEENAHIKVFYEDNAFGKEYADFLTKKVDEFNDTIKNIARKINFSIIEVASNSKDRRYFNPGKYLDESANNIVFIPSFNQGYVHGMLTHLYSKLNAYDIKVFGMPNWLSYGEQRLEYLSELQLHYTTSRLVRESEESEVFSETYEEKYKKKPTEMGFFGYDIANITNNILEKYGTNLKLTNGDFVYKGLVKNIALSVVEKNDEQIRLENTELFILKVEDFSLILQE